MSTATTTSHDTGQHTASRSTTQPTDTPVTQTTPNAAQRLRTTMAAVKLSFTWLGVRKTLAPAHQGKYENPRRTRPLTLKGHQSRVSPPVGRSRAAAAEAQPGQSRLSLLQVRSARSNPAEVPLANLSLQPRQLAVRRAGVGRGLAQRSSRASDLAPGPKPAAWTDVESVSSGESCNDHVPVPGCRGLDRDDWCARGAVMHGFRGRDRNPLRSTGGGSAVGRPMLFPYRSSAGDP